MFNRKRVKYDVAGNDGEARTWGLRGQRKNRAFILRAKVATNEPCRCLSLHFESECSSFIIP